MVIEGIGAWLCADPADFLQDNYLKYMGWALSDQVRTQWRCDCSGEISLVGYSPTSPACG